MSAPANCMVAIVNGEVRAAVAMNASTFGDTLAEWAADPQVSELIKVPVEVARRFLFEAWPGRAEALATIVQVEDRP